MGHGTCSQLLCFFFHHLSVPSCRQNVLSLVSLLSLRTDCVYVQEEEFADTGYQIAPSDPGEGSAPPSSLKQLGALTAEDFTRKLGGAKDDSRYVSDWS